MAARTWIAGAVLIGAAGVGGYLLSDDGSADRSDVAATTTTASDQTDGEPTVVDDDFCGQIEGLQEYYRTVSPASATSLEFMKRNRELLGSVTAIPPQLSGQWSVNLSQQDEAIRLMEEAGATDLIDAPPEVFDMAQGMGAFGQVIAGTVQATCGTTLNFGG